MGTYLNFDDSRTILCGRTVKSSFIWAWSPSTTLWGDQKLWKNVFLTKRNTFYFFLKNNILVSIGPGCFVWGPGPGSTAHIFMSYAPYDIKCHIMTNYAYDIEIWHKSIWSILVSKAVSAIVTVDPFVVITTKGLF